MEEIEWILCPVCKSKTRLKIRKDTVLKNFPLFCPKCKQETIITIRELNMSVIKEPDAKTGKPKKPLPTHAVIASAGRLSRESFALLEQIRTIDRIRLREWIGRLDVHEMEKIDQALSISVGLAPALF